MMEFGKRIADKHGITYADEDELRKKLADLPNLKYILTETIKETIASGLFFDEYVSLCNSHGHKAIYGTTKLTHSEIIQLWQQERLKTVSMINKLIESGELELQTNTERFFETYAESTYSTGTSLYRASHNLPFVQAYKQNIDSAVPQTYAHYCVQQSDIPLKYSTLLQFKVMADNTSSIYEVPVSDQADEFLQETKEAAHLLHLSLAGISDDIRHDQWKDNDNPYPIKPFLPDLSVQLEDTEPQHSKTTQRYEEKLVKEFGGRWKTL
jgi:hypothetical protein